MSVVPRLFELYRNQGFDIVTGLNPSHWGGLTDAPFTRLLRRGENVTEGLGIALQEIFFLECLFTTYKPKRLFVIGNSFGWSAVALALFNPGARVVAMDAGFDAFSLDGLRLTNDIAAAAGLDLLAVQGVSPQDVGSVLGRCFDAPVDFVFIDGYHENEQVVKDFRAVRPAAAAETVYVFHDVKSFNLHDGFQRVLAESGLEGHVLHATPSGVAMCFPPALAAQLAPTLAVFAPAEPTLAVVAAAAWRHSHHKWTRSLIKRVDAVRGLLNLPPLPRRIA